MCRTQPPRSEWTNAPRPFFICSRPRSSFCLLPFLINLRAAFCTRNTPKRKAGGRGGRREGVCALWTFAALLSSPGDECRVLAKKMGIIYACIVLFQRRGNIRVWIQWLVNEVVQFHSAARGNKLYSPSSFSADDDFVYYKTVHSAGEGDAWRREHNLQKINPSQHLKAVAYIQLTYTV